MSTSFFVNSDPGQSQTVGFRHRVGNGFLGLSLLYCVYAVGAFFGLEAEASVEYRIVMVLRMAITPLPVLLAPAVYVAALDDFVFGGFSASTMQMPRLRVLGLLALGAGIATAAGPPFFDYAIEYIAAAPAATLPQEGMVTDSKARTMMPIAVALFVFVAAIAGSVIGRRTRGFSDDRRIVTRWVAGVLLVTLFFFTTFVVGELIVMHGALSPLWLAIAPPLVPFLLTCAVAGRDCARVAQSLVSRIRDRRPRMDPAALDDLVTAIREADDPEAAAAAVIARGGADREMTALVGGLSRVGATAASAIDESRVQEIVDVLATKTGPDLQVAPLPDDPLPGPGRAQIAASVVVIWISLTTGLLLLGGADIATPTLVSASAAGALGAWASIEIACRDKARAFSSAAV